MRFCPDIPGFPYMPRDSKANTDSEPWWLPGFATVPGNVLNYALDVAEAEVAPRDRLDALHRLRAWASAASSDLGRSGEHGTNGYRAWEEFGQLVDGAILMHIRFWP